MVARTIDPGAHCLHRYCMRALRQVMHSSRVYARLGERLGVQDHQAVLHLMLTKIATNLKVYGSSEMLVHLTLQLFQVCVGIGRGDLEGPSLITIVLGAAPIAVTQLCFTAHALS